MCINGVKKVNVFLPVCSKFNLLSEMGLSTLHNCFVSCSLDFEIITLVLQSSSYSTCFWGPTTAFLLLLFIYVLTIIEYLFIGTIYYSSKSVFFSRAGLFSNWEQSWKFPAKLKPSTDLFPIYIFPAQSLL